MKILVTGASGYIGGRLVSELLGAGHTVRCLARTPAKLYDNPWYDDVEVVQGDVSDPDSTRSALDGMDAAYYLVHSIGEGDDWEDFERECATVFRDAAQAVGLGQIIYLGGLGRDDEDLSEHLESRHEVGRILASGDVPCTELRAAVIIGSGSASFEMLRNLVEVLPAMTTPRWVETPCQPIAVRDILYYLVGVLGDVRAHGQVYEVGGPDVLTYRQMMQAYAKVAGLRRRIIVPVPVLSPYLSGLWVGLVTPIPPSLARPLIMSLVNDVRVHDNRIRDLLPRELLSYEEAVELALRRVNDLNVATSWRDAHVQTPADPLPTDPDWAGGTVVEDAQDIYIDATPEDVFATVVGIGGSRGWFSPLFLWQVRGAIDLLFGGIGPRRGRRHPEEVGVGDVVDYFRVEAVEPPKLLRLRAEMKMPGDGWLEFHIMPEGSGARLTQRARFHPRGLPGRLYWYSLLPFHAIIFKQMQNKMKAAAELLADEREQAGGGQAGSAAA